MAVRYYLPSAHGPGRRDMFYSTNPEDVWQRIGESLPPLDKTRTSIQEEACMGVVSFGQLRALVSERQFQALVLQWLAEGRTDLADLWLRTESGPFRDAAVAIMELISNPTDSPNHECCPCSQEDLDYADCPECMDRSMDGACVACYNMDGVLDDLHELAELSPELKGGLDRVIKRLDELTTSCEPA